MKSYGRVKIRGRLMAAPRTNERGRTTFRVGVVRKRLVGERRLEHTEHHTVHAWGWTGERARSLQPRCEVLVEGDLRSWRRRSAAHGGWEAGSYVRAESIEQVGPPGEDLMPSDRGQLAKGE